MAIFAPLFDALSKSNVRYVVVGGLATVLHGYPRLTVDIDLMVDLAPEQAEKVISTLTSLGLVPQLPLDPTAFANPQTRQTWNREKNMQVFSMIDPQNPLRIVDLFVENPIPFEDIWGRSITVQVNTVSIRIASLVDLIHLKRLAGRPQDLLDIEQLEQIQKQQEGATDG
ncbi:MAG: DUF6036 family nucleotidyltransferase [Nitrospirota bacterium]|nr:DUF6036 family nucleotidyltransferase [Nitrospirota bacterium]